VRVQRVALEDHREVAGARREIGDVAAADHDLAGRRLLQPRDQAEQRRLAAPGRPDQHHELAVADLQRDVVDGHDTAAELLRHAVDQDLGHRLSSNPVVMLPREPVPRRARS
jgi:hypothetical protein